MLNFRFNISGSSVENDTGSFDIDNVLKISFILLSVLFLITSIYLASINNYPGLPDARNNLDTARNIIEGKGFTTNIIQQLFVELHLPGPESHRPPGIPYLLAFMFQIFGISMAIPILLNALAAYGSALLIFMSLRKVSAGWFSYLGGILMLLSDNYIIDSILNNNFIVLCTAALIYIFASHEKSNYLLLKLAVWFAVIGAIGFMMKPTFIISVFLVAVYVIAIRKQESGTDSKRKVLYVGLFLVLLAIMTSPYWIFNLINFGKPVFSPLTSFRLVERYGGFPQDTWWYFRIGNIPTYQELFEIYGTGGFIRREVEIWVRAAVAFIKINPAILMIVLAGLCANMRKLKSRSYIPPILLFAEPLFSAFLYWRGEDRYVWPVYPASIYLAGLLIRDYGIAFNPEPKIVLTPFMKKLIFVMLVLAVIFGAYRAERPWRKGFEYAGYKTPDWVEVVSAVNNESVVLTDDPWSVAWFTGKYAVICPAGEREDLLGVMNIYHPDFYLHTGRGYSYSPGKGQLAFEPDDLTLLENGDGERGEWRFYSLADKLKTENIADLDK